MSDESFFYEEHDFEGEGERKEGRREGGRLVLTAFILRQFISIPFALCSSGLKGKWTKRRKEFLPHIPRDFANRVESFNTAAQDYETPFFCRGIGV